MNETVAKAFDLALSVIGRGDSAPENMAGPPGVAPQSESPGNIAAAVNAGAFGPPSAASPMDNVKVVRQQPQPDYRSAPCPTPERVKLVVAEIERSAALNTDIVGDVITKAEIATAKGFARGWAKLNEASNQLTPTSARAAHRAHIDAMTAKLAAGEGSVSEGDFWNYEEFLSDYQLRQSAVKSELRKIEAAAAEFCRPIRERFASAVTALANHIEAQSVRRAEIFGCPYVQSAEVAMLRRLAFEITDPHQFHAGNPVLMLPFVSLQ